MCAIPVGASALVVFLSVLAASLTWISSPFPLHVRASWCPRLSIIPPSEISPSISTPPVALLPLANEARAAWEEMHCWWMRAIALSGEWRGEGMGGGFPPRGTPIDDALLADLVGWNEIRPRCCDECRWMLAYDGQLRIEWTENLIDMQHLY